MPLGALLITIIITKIIWITRTHYQSLIWQQVISYGGGVFGGEGCTHGVAVSEGFETWVGGGLNVLEEDVPVGIEEGVLYCFGDWC